MCETKGCTKALGMFKEKFNCAESVLSGIACELNLETDNIPKIASGFGAGFARQGYICGALSGASMGLGLKYGRTTPDNDAKAALYARINELFTSFEKEFGHIHCSGLTGCDMKTDEGAAEFASRDLHNTLCPKFVKYCVEYATDIINRDI